MHLLVTQPGEINDGSEAIDLGQSPGNIIFLSAAASELALLSDAAGNSNDLPSLRLANIMQLTHNMSVDVYLENTVSEAQLVVVRLLGGVGYWSYGADQLLILARENGIKLAVLPGDDQPDPELAAYCTLPPETCHRLWQYCAHGGRENAENFLSYAASLLGEETTWKEPVPLVRAGLYWPGRTLPSLEQVQAEWQKDKPTAAIVFYRALMQSGDLKPVDRLVNGLKAQGLNPLPIFVSSLKDAANAELVQTYLNDTSTDVILNLTGFAVSSPGAETSETPFTEADCPVLQVILSGGPEEDWLDGTRGLAPRDLAMNVALPEVDGRLITRAISFKKSDGFDQDREVSIIRHEPVADRIKFVTETAATWAKLRRTKASDRKTAIVVANYPNKDGRLCNGVGLDTPAGVASTLKRLKNDGYELPADYPGTSEEVVALLQSGPTNSGKRRSGRETVPAESYEQFFNSLPEAVRKEVTERWGPPKNDPFFKDGRFYLPVHRLGNIALGIQPARGYNIDPVASYHDPDLVPPHGYIAFYAWVREEFGAHAIIHFGKHGNLEWLPGKALALSETCYPEAIMGPLPHLYPFIVNDPGEGTQAKRRAQAVVIDHLTPPLTRAESYGPLRDLEQLVDEYYLASGMDPRRLKLLSEQILDLSQSIGLDKDVGIASEETETESLSKIDNYLCELKELQIRYGLHIFGTAPDGRLKTDLLVALTRLPRFDGSGEHASLIRALAADLNLDFDPLDCTLGNEWTGPRPDSLKDEASPWRTNGDTVERLEDLAQSLVSGECSPDPAWTGTQSVLDFIRTSLAPTVEACGRAELDGLMTGLQGRFVAPGASGAPTRGRLDTLPTGRNFYSVDSRSVPTPAAWQLGWKSASLLIERHFQDHGEFPQRLAMSAWGTANMRTGGDDIAQALALMGVKPQWDKQSQRVTGFEVLPLDVLGRPRVDVVLRISGFFRDAFPAQVDLLDSAARAVAALEDEGESNPLSRQVAADRHTLEASGLTPEDAARKAGHRIFGSMPGAYGAGLQTLIDEKCWETDEDLSKAYVAWGGYAYGGGTDGIAEHSLFESRLKNVNVVVHNQDNREHDLLDSDDYYQFEGGLTAAVRQLSGTQPTIYHNDHSRPERPRIGTLAEEVGRIVRARAANPKWIDGVMRHGYKGAFEVAATVDYLFAFAATSRVVENHHFDQLFEAYVEDERVRDFIEQNNPDALSEIADRFEEAIDRGFWHPRSNSAGVLLNRLRGSEAA